MQVKQFHVKNQYVIEDDNGVVEFQSYNSKIAKIDGDNLTLYRDWGYSQTTKKYLYMFLSEYAYKIHDLNLRAVIVNMMQYCDNKRQHLQTLIDKKFINYVED